MKLIIMMKKQNGIKMGRVCELIKLADKWYSNKKFRHAIRVAEYAMEQPFLSKTEFELRESLFVVGLLHDVLEDTKITPKEFYECPYIHENEYKAIEILTHNKEKCSYEEYIQKIIDSKNLLAFLVKKADLKDHLTMTDTLTDKLKNKYYPIIKYFL